MYIQNGAGLLEYVKGAAFIDEMEKLALSALTRRIVSAGGIGAQQKAISALPSALRSQQAYKFLGRQAAGTAAKMSDAAGHGAQHVFNVTRNAQRLATGAPQQVRQRATLGALLHDVGRGAEGIVRKRIGKQAFSATPGVWHSELGGRYASSFLRRYRPVSQYVPGMGQGRLSGVVRAHDTDIHAIKPWTESRLRSDPAAGAVYLGDKMEGMGRIGAERTVQMGQKFSETPAQTWGVAQQNLDKYNRVLRQYATPTQAQLLQPRVDEYGRLMRTYRDTGVLPPMQKAAMAVNDFKRLLAGPVTNATARAMRNLAKKTRGNAKADLFNAIYSTRPKRITEVGERIRYILGLDR